MMRTARLAMLGCGAKTLLTEDCPYFVLSKDQATQKGRWQPFLDALSRQWNYGKSRFVHSQVQVSNTPKNLI